MDVLGKQCSWPLSSTLGNLPGVSRDTEKDDTPSEILPNKGSGKYSTFQICVISLIKKKTVVI